MEDPNVAKLGQFRVFVQEDGISPENPYYYHGDLSLGGVNEPQGDLTPIYLPSPDQREQWDIVGFTRGVPGLPTTDFTARMQITMQQVWWGLRKRRCPVNMQVLAGICERPDDINSWRAKMLLNRNVITDFTGPVINPLTGEENEVGNLTGSMTMLSLEVILPIRFQEYADATIQAEALDGFYNGLISCGECGASDDGCDSLYVLTKNNPGSPGLSSQVVYTRNDKSTFTARDISSLGGKNASRMVPMGKYLVVISEDDRAHHIISFSDLHAGNTANWRKISTGYVAASGPRAIYRLSSLRAIVVGAGGYIYRITNPTAAPTILSDGSITTQNFNDVGGFGNTVVAVGNSRAIAVSINKGDSFSLIPPVDSSGAAINGNVTAVGVIDSSQWFIGIGGRLYYTVNGGEYYTLHGDWPADITVVNRINFVDKQVGYIAAEANLVGRVYRTDSVGNQWDNTAPSIDDLPDAVRYNFAAPCGYNEVAAGGYSGSEGILAVAS